jgi:hypothetical protein
MQKSTLFSLVAAIVAGVLVGYLLQGFLRRGAVTVTDPAPLLETSGAAKTEFTPDELQGFCCMQKGQQCSQSPSDEICLGNGGYAFAYSAEDCAIVCAPVTP